MESHFSRDLQHNFPDTLSSFWSDVSNGFAVELTFLLEVQRMLQSDKAMGSTLPAISSGGREVKAQRIAVRIGVHQIPART